MNLLKAQDTKLKLAAFDYGLDINIVVNEKTKQHEVKITIISINRVFLPEFVKAACDRPYVIEASREREGYLDFIIF